MNSEKSKSLKPNSDAAAMTEDREFVNVEKAVEGCGELACNRKWIASFGWW
jgi:hypothetical protein